MNRLLTPGEVAKRLVISPSTLKWWRSKRRGPEWVTVGRHIRYPEANLDSWLARQPGTVTAEPHEDP